MHKRELTPRRCATCDVELTPCRKAIGFCCSGCERGGPCTCSYDEDVPLVDGRQGVPISAAAFAQIQQRLMDVTGDVDLLLPDANAHAAEGIAHVGFYLLVRQQRQLRALLDRAVVMAPDGRALLGSTVTVRDPDGSHDRLALVTAVEADPRVGRISIEAPIGAALLGRRAGDVVTVRAPAGLRDLTVVAVDL